MKLLVGFCFPVQYGLDFGPHGMGAIQRGTTSVSLRTASTAVDPDSAQYRG